MGGWSNDNRDTIEWDGWIKGKFIGDATQLSQASASANGVLSSADWNTFNNKRPILSANRTYYVRTDGSDSNNGLTNNSGGAFLTIQKAYNVATTLDLNGFNVIIKLGNTGTFTTGLTANVALVGGNLIIEGDTTTPSNTLVSVTGGNSVITWANSSQLTCQYFKIATDGSGGHGIVSLGPSSYVIIGTNMDFGSINSAFQIRAVSGGYVRCTNNYTISGGVGGNGSHIQATVAGIVEYASPTITLSGTPAYSIFISSSSGSNMSMYNITFNGSATGSRYSVDLNSTIQTYGGGANYFPGNSAGTTATGGQYA